jgi:hypothetical protein
MREVKCHCVETCVKANAIVYVLQYTYCSHMFHSNDA